MIFVENLLGLLQKVRQAFTVSSGRFRVRAHAWRGMFRLGRMLVAQPVRRQRQLLGRRVCRVLKLLNALCVFCPR